MAQFRTVKPMHHQNICRFEHKGYRAWVLQIRRRGRATFLGTTGRTGSTLAETPSNASSISPIFRSGVWAPPGAVTPRSAQARKPAPAAFDARLGSRTERALASSRGT